LRFATYEIYLSHIQGRFVCLETSREGRQRAQVKN